MSSPRIVSADLGAGVLLFEPDTGKVHELNPTGRTVWACLELGQGAASIAGRLRALEGAPGDDAIRTAVDSFLSTLETEGVLRAAGTISDMSELVTGAPLEVDESIAYSDPALVTHQETDLKAAYPEAFRDIRFSDMWTGIEA